MRGLLLGIPVIALLAGTMAAGACGLGQLTAMMFRVYPEARRVSDAELVAARAGLLGSGPATANAPRDLNALHAWRAARIAEMATRFDKRLRAVANPLGRSGKAHVFLIHEFKWLELAATENGFRLATQTGFPSGDGVRIFTTERVMASVLDGRLGWSTAVGKNLVVARGPEVRSAPWLNALRDAVKRSNPSGQVAN